MGTASCAREQPPAWNERIDSVIHQGNVCCAIGPIVGIAGRGDSVNHRRPLPVWRDTRDAAAVAHEVGHKGRLKIGAGVGADLLVATVAGFGDIKIAVAVELQAARVGQTVVKNGDVG